MSNSRYAYIFPGQGAQYVGMGKDFYESFRIAKDTFDEAENILNFHLKQLIFEGPLNDLTLTKNSQIAIYVTSIAILRVLSEKIPTLSPSVVSGLSLGEYSALTAANRLSFTEGVTLVRSRGLYMHQASIDHPGTMAVCLGLEPSTVQSTIQSIPNVWIANLNCPGQVVISGSLEAIQKASLLLAQSGAKRVLPLNVSGAFHSGLMADAEQHLSQDIHSISLNASTIDIVMNVSGQYTTDNTIIQQSMIQQLTQPVLWEKSIRTITQSHSHTFIEIGCGKTLRGMLKKTSKDITCLSLETINDLTQLEENTCKG